LKNSPAFEVARLDADFADDAGDPHLDFAPAEHWGQEFLP
jgi:hypothetical protein